MARNALRVVMQIEPAPLIQQKTENCKKEREKWGIRDEITALLFSDAKPEMTEQNWRQQEDYPTALLTQAAEPCSNISGYLWAVLLAHSPAVTDRWGTSPWTCAANIYSCFSLIPMQLLNSPPPLLVRPCCWLLMLLNTYLFNFVIYCWQKGFL